MLFLLSQIGKYESITSQTKVTLLHVLQPLAFLTPSMHDHLHVGPAMRVCKY